MEPETEQSIFSETPLEAPTDGKKNPWKNPEWRRFFRMHPRLKTLVGIIGISFITSLIVMAIAGAIGWAHRDKIAALLISTLPPQAAAPLVVVPTVDEPVPTPVLDEVPRDFTVTEVVAKVNPSVVSIEVMQGSGVFAKSAGKGTGFFVTSNGLIITNRHVVDTENTTLSITTSSGKKYPATLIAMDPVFDLAVIKVQGTGFPAATLGDSNSLALGQSVVAIGFALGKFENSISVGVISGLSRSIIADAGNTTEQLDRVIQTDAAINPGNSGGPLINMRGEVVGVNVAMARGSQSIGFSIPSDSVKQVVDSVKVYGKIIRPYVGVSYNQIDDTVQQRNDLSVDYGVYISAVLPDSPASRAGILAGDIILSIDGTKLDGDPSFSSIIRDKKVGQSVRLGILRDGTQSTLKVVLAQAPDS